MGAVTSVLRMLSDFGDAAGWPIAALVLFACGRRIIQENEKAHAAITENVKENRERIDALGETLNTVARDVAILRDRSLRAS